MDLDEYINGHNIWDSLKEERYLPEKNYKHQIYELQEEITSLKNSIADQCNCFMEHTLLSKNYKFSAKPNGSSTDIKYFPEEDNQKYFSTIGQFKFQRGLSNCISYSTPDKRDIKIYIMSQYIRVYVDSKEIGKIEHENYDKNDLFAFELENGQSFCSEELAEFLNTFITVVSFVFKLGGISMEFFSTEAMNQYMGHINNNIRKLSYAN